MHGDGAGRGAVGVVEVEEDHVRQQHEGDEMVAGESDDGDGMSWVVQPVRLS